MSIFFSGSGGGVFGNNTKSILKAQPSDYQGFMVQMKDSGPTYCKTGGGGGGNSFSGGGGGGTSRYDSGGGDQHSKQNRRVRLFLEEEQSKI